MSARDVAVYILERLGPVPAVKLQKLVYYSQAWSLVWDDRPLFRERIEAWANGPVIPSLYSAHHREYEVNADMIRRSGGDSANLDASATETISAVIDFYGDESSQWLSDLTHREDPWIRARAGVPAGAPSTNVISWSSMADYYSSLS